MTSGLTAEKYQDIHRSWIWEDSEVKTAFCPESSPFYRKVPSMNRLTLLTFGNCRRSVKTLVSVMPPLKDAGIFFLNVKKQTAWTAKELLAGYPPTKTQFGTIADTLGIVLISACAPKAKDRIERLWGTLQDRLPAWFSLNGITTMEQANAGLHRGVQREVCRPA
jgi:hypothetical protein